MITELSARFDAVSSQHIEFMCLLPSTNTSSATEPHESNLQHILQLYKDDLPSPTTFNAELDLWKQKWSTDNQKAAEVNTAEKALEFADVDFYPNIRALLQIMSTLPVTSCECERSISMHAQVSEISTQKQHGTGSIKWLSNALLSSPCGHNSRRSS